ncbi:hypothetical protein C8T65DRAFT_788474 [Cerioporus squamosus]|nr:hypothetical protein C8T65DRAFT_788474 [Cerioporus squamosus]
MASRRKIIILTVYRLSFCTSFFWYLRRDKYCVSCCSRTCHLLRAVALEHLNFRRVSLQDVTTFDPFLQFLRRYPRVADTVVSVYLRGSTELDMDGRHSPTTTIDDTLVVSMVELLPKLESLALHSFHYIMPTASSALLPPAGPFPISSISIGTHFQERSSLTGALRILSLFTPDGMNTLTFDKPTCQSNPSTSTEVLTSGDSISRSHAAVATTPPWRCTRSL